MCWNTIILQISSNSHLFFFLLLSGLCLGSFYLIIVLMTVNQWNYDTFRLKLYVCVCRESMRERKGREIIIHAKLFLHHRISLIYKLLIIVETKKLQKVNKLSLLEVKNLSRKQRIYENIFLSVCIWLTSWKLNFSPTRLCFKVN